MPDTRVAVVEDDLSVREMLTAVLSHEGYVVLPFADAESAIHDPDAVSADALLLDVGLPGMSGIEMCQSWRRTGRMAPILMLTARHEIKDRVEGLDAGADDYLVKPFALEELLARVRVLTRRDAPAADELELDDLVISRSAREVRRGDAVLDLTKIEFDLLELLVANSPTVLTRAAIHDHVWGHDGDHMSNSLEVFMSQLRRKTEAPGGARLLHTVRGVGYVAKLEG